jgi:lysozyme
MSAKAKLAIAMGTVAAATAITVTGANEGLSLQPYWDAIGKVTTYCYGETDPKDIRPRYTRADCDEKLAQGLLDRYMRIRKCVPTMDTLTEGEKVAYLDLAYNIGDPLFCNNSIPKLIAAGRRVDACEKTKEYAYSRGTWVQGLFNRRVRVYDVCVRDLQVPA